MTDLDARLRADAAWSDPLDVPDLDNMLAAVRGRRRRRSWLLAAAALVVGATIAAVVAGHSAAPSRPPAHARFTTPAGLPDGPTTLQGYTRQYSDSLGVGAVFTASDNPAHLQLTFDRRDTGDLCWQWVSALHVVETNRTVEIRLAGYRYLDSSGDGPNSCPSIPTVDLVDVTLRRPLGTRTVLDGTGRVVVIDPSDLPDATYLPPGYRPYLDAPATLGDSQSVGVRYLGLRVWQDVYSRISLSVGRPQDVFASGRRVGLADVGGVTATVTRASDNDCLTWAETSGRNRQLCAPNTLGLPSLLRIARGLR